ncbi:nuclear envelope integral membrane protein-like [Ornithodoros turicata]|uniref:nuclear envelope integral membrane protein-like n=1 Tax=Ornithodoros turicata TaxID=34597 RepID=UPI0031391F4F
MLATLVRLTGLVACCVGISSANYKLQNFKPLAEGELYYETVPSGELKVYCYHGEPLSYFSLVRTLHVEFKVIPEKYTLFEGESSAKVHEQHEALLASWLPLLPWKQSTISFPTFRPHCIGLVSEDAYRFEFVIRRVNYWKLLQLVSAILLFYAVPSLCRNTAVFYSCGISVGVLASLLIIVFIASRFFPRKLGAYAVIGFGWSLSLYFFQILWANIYDVLSGYRSALTAYLAMSALISFAVCYRLGPPSNPRTLDLLQWSLQLVALIAMFLSSEIREATMSIVVIILTTYNFPRKWMARLRTWWRKRRPPKVVMLTEEEYIRQANEETQKALMTLRKYCSSPHCDAWRVMAKLRDPVRFAKFVHGESHLADAEILDYEVDHALASTDVDDTDDSDGEERLGNASYTELQR